jgi:hypothetical protein
VRRLRGEGKSIRQIADVLDVGKGTVERDLRALDVPEPPAAHPNTLANLDRARPVSGALPGNERALKHGANSERLVGPRAAELAEAAKATVPWLAERSFAPAVDAWARAEAGAALIAEYLDGLGGLLDDDGRPWPAVEVLLKFERRAEKGRARLGLDPASRARLEREMADVSRTRVDLDRLLRAGREAMARRTDVGGGEVPDAGS